MDASNPNPQFDLTGRTFGRWTVLERGLNTKHGTKQWRCRCACGVEKLVLGASLRKGLSRSCGCLMIEEKTKHGYAYSITYESWRSLLDRCLRKKAANYSRYGAKGITVCERWLQFENFLADMGERPPGTSIDRYPDRTGNYEPGNCRWATPMEQQRNRTGLFMISLDGVTKPVSEWAEISGVPRLRIWNRVRAKWDIRQAIFTPVAHRKTKQ